LDAAALHAPLIPTFPFNCQVSLLPILGCHQGAVWSFAMAKCLDRKLSFVLIKSYLEETGLLFGEKCPFLDVKRLSTAQVIAELDDFCTSRRALHVARARLTHCAAPVKIWQKKGDFPYLNVWHKAQKLEESDPSTADVFLVID
jgi:hypothetical protein